MQIFRMSKTSATICAVFLGTPGVAFADSNIGIVQADWYMRGEIGAAVSATDQGYWWGPGGPPADPRITFSLNNPIGITGSFAVGAQVMDGVRADISVGGVGNLNVEGLFLSASDGTPAAGHVTNISGTASAFAVMANLFVEPFRATGNDSAFQPFLTGGVGVSNVTLGPWTRINPAKVQVNRTWEGNSQLDFAWTLGAGASYALDDVMGTPAFLDLTYRYTDYGQATGGTAAVNPPPSNSPTEPFNFSLTTHTLTLGLRIPFAAR